GPADPLPDAILNREWTQTNGQSTHASGHLAGPAAPALAWQTDIGSGARITGAPIVAGSRVYAMDAASRLGAFDTGSGAVAWRTSLAPAGEPGSDGFGGGLATDGRLIYATTGFGEILGVDASSGE